MRPGLGPVLAATGAAAMWGLWWIPIRTLESYGLHGAWAGIAMNGGALALLVPAVTGRGIRLERRALVGAVLAGVAVSTYSAALNYTDVVRAVLLFYLAPVWSKLIEWLWLKMPWHKSTGVALAAALIGAWLVLGGEVGSGALNSGDVLSVVSGIAWAAGADADLCRWQTQRAFADHRDLAERDRRGAALCLCRRLAGAVAGRAGAGRRRRRAGRRDLRVAGHADDALGGAAPAARDDDLFADGGNIGGCDLGRCAAG